MVHFSLCSKKRRLLICKYDVFTCVLKPVHKDENCLVKWLLNLPVHNFINKSPTLTILVPINCKGPGLLYGTKLVQIGTMRMKLWYQQVGDQTRLLTR